MKLYELSDDPNRKIFLDTLLKFMEDRGQPIKNTPQVASHVLDLFRLYHIVKEKGGVVKVMHYIKGTTLIKIVKLFCVYSDKNNEVMMDQRPEETFCCGNSFAHLWTTRNL